MLPRLPVLGGIHFATVKRISLIPHTLVLTEYLMQIGALKEIKRELAARRNALMKSLVAEVERSTFEELAARPAENGGILLEATDLSHSPPRELTLRPPFSRRGCTRSPPKGQDSAQLKVEHSLIWLTWGALCLAGANGATAPSESTTPKSKPYVEPCEALLNLRTSTVAMPLR